MSRPAVVVVAFGPPDQLDACLSALGRGTDTVVVDNGSDPLTRAVVERHGAEYVDPGANLGFAAGVNRGLRRVPPGQDVLLLNPDALLDPRDLDLLHGALRSDPLIGAVAPRLVHPGGGPQRTSWPIPSAVQAWRDALALPQRGMSFLIGAVLLIRAEAIEGVGEFDERFFLYSEEADWQLRAQRAGWKVREVRAVTAVHAAGGTSSDTALRDSIFRRSGLIFVNKWSSGLSRVVWLGGLRFAALRRRYFRRPVQ